MATATQIVAECAHHVLSHILHDLIHQPGRVPRSVTRALDTGLSLRSVDSGSDGLGEARAIRSATPASCATIITLRTNGEAADE